MHKTVTGHKKEKKKEQSAPDILSGLTPNMQSAQYCSGSGGFSLIGKQDLDVPVQGLQLLQPDYGK